MDITLLITIAEEVAPEIIKFVQGNGGTATIQQQLDADRAQIESDAKTLEDEAKTDQ